MKQNYNRLLFRLVLLLTFVAGAKAQAQVYQDTYFVYSNADMMEITGLTDVGMAATELEIPATVTSVAINAFADAKTGQEPLTTITIKGNPSFDANAFGSLKENHHITEINMGSNMTVANMENVLNSLGTRCYLQTIDIDGWSGDWENITSHAVLREDVNVVLPAALVTDDKKWGNATICGSFNLNPDLELVTFCGSSTFYDNNDGSQFLFYIPTGTGTEDGHPGVNIQRVYYVVAGEGVLLHNVNHSSREVWLPRVPTEDANKDANYSSYSSNMLKGVTKATTINATEDNYTNMILYNGTFYPTEGGTLGANRAYLRVPKSVNAPSLRLIPYDESTGISKVEAKAEKSDESWYTLNGQHLLGRPSVSGLYIHDGRKVMVK